MIQKGISIYGVRGLSRKLGVTPAYVSMLASGKRNPSDELLGKLDVLTDLRSNGPVGVNKSTFDGVGNGAKLKEYDQDWVWWAVVDSNH